MSDIRLNDNGQPIASWWTAPALQVDRAAFYAAARAHCFVSDEKDAPVWKYLSDEDKSHRERGVKARQRAGYGDGT